MSDSGHSFSDSRAARAYARESEYSEEDALNRILDMFQAEIERPTDLGTTTPRGQKGH